MSEDEIPTIAEKVSFWQEQDRINQAIIPRVMEIHESLTAVGKRQSEISGQIAVLDARVMNPVQDLRTEIQAEMVALEHRVMESVHTIQSNVETQIRKSVVIVRLAYFALGVSCASLVVSVWSHFQ
jgi:hypothetical protein